MSPGFRPVPYSREIFGISGRRNQKGEVFLEEF
jgi:hypothetical protein